MDKSSINENILSKIISIGIFISLVIPGTFLLIMNIITWYYISYLNSYPSFLLFPIILLPVHAGGYLLSIYGIHTNNRGVKPFGLFFVISGFLYFIIIGFYHPILKFMEFTYGTESPIYQLYNFQNHAVTSISGAFALVCVLIAQILYFIKFEGKTIEFNGYFTQVRKLSS